MSESDDESARPPGWRKEWRPARQRRGEAAPPTTAEIPPLPDNAEECARHARAVAWRILHGASKDGDRMTAARFFVEQAKSAGNGAGPYDPNPLETLARAQAAARGEP